MSVVVGVRQRHIAKGACQGVEAVPSWFVKLQYKYTLVHAQVMSRS